jgi:hypothetical protein
MSGVWREQSVPMTDRECALLALESIGAIVTNHTNKQCSVSIGGKSWTMSHTNGRYAIRYNARNRVNRPTWMDGLSEAYSQQIRLKQERLARQEQVAAKALGYRVKESVQNGEVRLVLVKTG